MTAAAGPATGSREGHGRTTMTSDESCYVTGIGLVVDGGMKAW